jgi:TRAP-type C4-dicarboxylate transport system substrate-binding protein
MERAVTGIGRMTPLVLAVVAAAALGGCGGAGSNKAGGAAPRRIVVLTLANGPGAPRELDGFAREVSRLSGGTIRISVENGWRVGQVNYENGLINDVRRGKADLGASGSRAWDALGIDSLRALATPLLINSYELEQRVLESSLIPPMLAGLSQLGLVGLGVLPGPLQRPLGLTRPLLAPSDYSGLRFGAPQSSIAQVTLRALGATPVVLAASAPTGLGGVAEHITAIQENRYDEPGSYLSSNVVLWPRPLVVFANDKAIARLTPTQRRILTRALTAEIIPESNAVQSDERYGTGVLCRRHHLRFVTATPVDLRALGRAVQPVYRELDRNAQNRFQIARIEAMRTWVHAGAAPSCALSGVPAAKLGSAGQLDGVYRFTINDYGELQAAGADSSELNPGNVGTETFVFDRGHFAETVENPQACTWAYGTIMVTGAKISLSYSDGGGYPPAWANQPGEQFTLKWSLYRDSLTMRHGPGGAGPTPFVVRPWLRVSTTPSYDYLSKRCPPPANALPG